ncbi:uncharacterized protein LOC115264985 [Aedes albopictus]|uniref:Secreted protein n=1 Tax=Aedes albopictus TaxID=7160 RepID=A0ABM1Z4B5_AEDAL|nr:uncharacterized protein LOC115264985 [Aedes albopictus]
MSSNTQIGALKLCKRSFFLQSGTVPSQTGMRHELGSEVADVILECMSSQCQAWMGVDRKLQGPSVYCLDPEQLKHNIHEHILQLGQQAEDRLERRRRRKAKKKDISEELEFVKFECRQKIEIARDEERKRMEALLEEAKFELAEKFQLMKKELGEDYCRGRREMAQFMCRNLRNQVRGLLVQIAQRYRVELDHEVDTRVSKEFRRIADQLDEIVQDAVNHQKAIDEEAMRKMCYRYEELLRNVRHREACSQLTTLAQQICSQWIELSKQKMNPDISCQTSFVIPEPTTTDAGSDMTSAESEGFEGPNSLLELDEIFVIESCFMHPGPSPVYSYASSSFEEDVPESSTTLEAFTFEGNVYAQPKYFQKVYEQLFPTPMLTWEPRTAEEEPRLSMDSLLPINSDFTRNVVNQILNNADLQEEDVSEVQLTSIDLDVEPSALYEPSECDDSLLSSSETTVSGLFALEKSESAINILANGIVLKYVRATEKDFQQ